MKIAALLPTHQHIYNKKKQQRINIKNYFGLSIVINEIEKYFNVKVDIVDHSTVNNYDIVLFSCHSISDYYAMVYTVERKLKGVRKGIWICGGSGIANLNPLINYFEYIVIGRAESLIIELIIKLNSRLKFIHESVINTKEYNQYQDYKINYVSELYKEEINGIKEVQYGCNLNCYFCRYRYSALPPSKQVKNKIKYQLGNEETFFDLEIINGSFYTTSLDGLTEFERKVVNKPISNIMIKNKLLESSKKSKKINLKIYFIVGYPTQATPNFIEFIQVLNEVSQEIKNCSMFLSLHFTPFSAEPNTPMQWESMNFEFDYRKYFDDLIGRKGYLFESDNIKAMIMRTTIKPLELIKRAIFNRAFLNDMDIIKYLAAHPEQTSHMNNNTKKLELLKAKYNIDKYQEKLNVGSKIASSNIKSWQEESKIEAMANSFSNKNVAVL